MLVELFGKNMYAVLVFNDKNDLIDSTCNMCFDDKNKKKILSMSRKTFKEKENLLFNW